MEPKTNPFPPLHIINPKPNHTHTHTIILLHGRGSNGPEFAEEFLLSDTTPNLHLPSHFPSWRWVFPTSKTRWSSVFEEEFPAWFDIRSLTDPYDQVEVQVEGLRESTRYVLGLVEDEVEILGKGKGERVIVGGMSQGMAVGLWSLFCMGGTSAGATIERRIGGFVGLCGWLPFARQMEEVMREREREGKGDIEMRLEVLRYARRVIGYQDEGEGEADIGLISSTPMLLLHGTDDAFVDVELGRQAGRVLERMGTSVDQREYTGAENEGHWVKEPEGFQAIVDFLRDVSSR